MERREARWRRGLSLRGAWVERDVEDEIAFHYEMRVRDFVGAGMTPEEARREAARRLGDVDEVKRWLERHDRRRIRRTYIGEALMEVLGDVRLGVRKLVQQPAFALAVIAVLALGTGATTAIFSAVDAVLLRPLPFQEPERLVTLNLSLPFDPGFEEPRPKSGPDITDARLLTDLFTGVAAWAPGGLNLTDAADPRRLAVGVVTPNLFATLGVGPMLGRAFTPAEEVPGAPPAAILSHRIWRSNFGSDPAAVGREIVLNGKPYRIVGVMPPGFEFPEASEVWLPLSVPYTFESIEPFRQFLPSRTVARLAPGATVEQAGERVLALFRQYETPERPVTRTAAELAWPLRETLVGQRRTSLLVLMGATALVLVVACANVANLLLSRATVRRREVALRSVLGATPGRVLRQLATESLVLAAAGGLAGVALALGAIRVLDVLVPPSLTGLSGLQLDGRVLAFALTVALGTGFVFGLWPALDARRTRPGDAVRRGTAGAGADGGAARLRQAFVVGEIALALMLLVGSTLMLRSLHTLMTADSGVDAHGVATLELTLPAREHEGVEGRRLFYSGVLERLQADPRVEAAAAVNELPLRGAPGVRFLLHPEGQRPQEMDVRYMAQDLRVTPDYFRAMGIRVLAGRAPLPEAESGGDKEIAISESLARLYWPDRWPIGERMEGFDDRFLVVGVVADVRPTSVESEFIPQAYYPMMDNPYANGALIVRGRAGADELARSLSAAVREVAPTQAVYNVRSMDEVIAGAIRTRRTNTALITTFGVLALVLSAVGVYGVMAYSVARRTREIGIRIALGARSRSVMKAVLREGLLLALAGTALGLGGAWALARVMEGLLYGVAVRDPLTFVVAPAALLLVATVAALLPSWRATRVNPVEAMRVE